MSTSQQPGLATFDALPPALHLSVILYLPLVTRVRSALVSRRWAALLSEPAFWAEFSFEGANEQRLDSEVLAQLIRRAAGNLCLLDISAECCKRLALPRRVDGSALAMLAAEGLLGRLQVLSAVEDQMVIKTPDDARRLLAACPSLSSAKVFISGYWPDAVAAMRLLPLAEGASVRLMLVKDGDEATTGLVAFATAVAEALAGCQPLSCITFLPTDDWLGNLATLHRASTASASAKVQAYARLVAALADPLRGPEKIHDAFTLFGGSPIFAEICRALTPHSRLKCLYLEESFIENDDALALADALASGPGGKLDTVCIGGGDLRAGGGCAFAHAGSRATSVLLFAGPFI